jgi:hypothetical protein
MRDIFLNDGIRFLEMMRESFGDDKGNFWR